MTPQAAEHWLQNGALDAPKDPILTIRAITVRTEPTYYTMASATSIVKVQWRRATCELVILDVGSFICRLAPLQRIFRGLSAISQIAVEKMPILPTFETNGPQARLFFVLVLKSLLILDS